MGDLDDLRREVVELRQQLAEETLRGDQRPTHESPSVFEQVQALAHVGSWVREGDGLTWSREMYRLFGLTEGAPIQFETFLGLVHPEDRPVVLRKTARAREGQPYEAEYRIVRPGGDVRWLYSKVVPGAVKDGNVKRLVGVAQDVTDRRRYVDELRASAQRYRRLLETTSEGVIAVGADGKIIFVNGRAGQTLDLAPEELVGRLVVDLAHDDHRAAFAAQCARGDVAAEPFTTRFKRKDGSTRWVSVHRDRLLDDAGRYDGALLMVTDISERRQADETRHRLAAIVESSHDAIFSVTLESIVTSWNAAAERLFGYTAEEIVGRSAAAFVPGDRRDEHAEMLARMARGETVQPYETMHRRRDGTLTHVSVTLSPLRDAEGHVIGASKIIRDLTERDRSEAALRRTEEQLRHAQKMEAIGVLAGGVAHDFNNVLSVILSYGELLAQALPQHESLGDDLREIRAAAERGSALVGQLLAFSRQQVREPRLIDLNQTVDGMQRMLRRLLGEDVHLTLATAREPCHLHADPGQVEQVLMNLVVNARDAMPTGGQVTIETARVEVLAGAEPLPGMSPGHYVLLTVSDTGTGIDAATRARIFEPFFTTKPLGKGTGLGLSTVFGIVQQSGGHVTVESEQGRGATFKVFLPAASAPSDEVAVSVPPAKEIRGTETILVAEDDEQVRAIMRTVLRRSGYLVLEAQNAGEALLVSEKYDGRIHLLLTDVVMPRVSGRELAERLLAARPELRVLFVSGYTRDAIVLNGVLDASLAFLHKPITPGALTRKVRDVLDARGSAVADQAAPPPR